MEEGRKQVEELLQKHLDGLRSEMEKTTGLLTHLKAEIEKAENAFQVLSYEAVGEPMPGDPTPKLRVRRARKGPRKHQGSRKDQALSIIQEYPEITAPQIAKMMGIKPNYLYRLLGELERAGLVKKDKKSYSAI